MKGVGERAVLLQKPVNICYANGLYNLAELSGDLERGIAFMMLRQVLDREPLALQSDIFAETELRAMGRSADLANEFRADLVERELAARFDGPFVRLADQLALDQPPSSAAQRLARRFLLAAQIRNPVYRFRDFDHDADEAERASVRELFEQLDDAHLVAYGALHETQARVLRKLFYGLALLGFLDDERDIADPNVPTSLLLLRSPECVGFVQTDHPAFPLQVLGGRAVVAAPWPGLRSPNAGIPYPLSPDYCLVHTARVSAAPFLVRTASASLVRAINTGLATVAHRHIVLPPHLDDVFERDFDPLETPPWQVSGLTPQGVGTSAGP